MKSSTLLITGIHGLVGQYLFGILDRWEGNVVITGKGLYRLPDKGFQYEELDLTDSERINTLFDTYKPDVVIHSAAMAQPDACELNQEDAIRVNVTATQDLLEAAARHRAFFIFMSTDFVFSGAEGPYGEEDVLAPVNFYGRTKLMGEELVRQYICPSAIIRTGLVYGNVIVGTRPNVISWVRESLENNLPIKVVSDQLRTPTYARDLANALLFIAQGKAAGTWHIAGKDVLSPWEMALKVADHLKLDASLMTKVDASIFSQPAQRPLRTPLLIDKAVRELHYQPVSFEEGMINVLQGF
jgi:dTDP-4-dehydrorhamnose reductase